MITKPSSLAAGTPSMWRFTVPGQPLSQNHAYVPVIRRDRRGRPFRARALSDEARAWMDSIGWIVKAARPAGWAPEGQIRVICDLYLTRDIDDDNVWKLLGDAIEAATGINDRWFLRCTRSKTTGLSLSQARIEVEIVDLSQSLSLEAAPS